MGKRRKRNCNHLLDKSLQGTKRLKSSDSDDDLIAHSDYEYEEPAYLTLTYPNILPNMQELNIIEHISPHVEPLPRDGKYRNWQQYLSLHFNLLREDFIAPLRKGILEYKNNCGVDTEQSEIRVYHEARFTRLELKNDGILLCVSFKAYIKEEIPLTWLINGSLLCFSSDNFKTILFATVANRDQNFVNEGEILVKFESDINCLSVLGINTNGWILEQKEYAMVELIPHYETYALVLKSLKNTKPNEMRFTQYLIDCNYHRLFNPQYLRRDPVFNMESLLKTKHPNYYDITNPYCWSCHKDTDLDDSQKKAVQQALTQEVSLIQGPPGTGKTYVGQKIIEVLLNNREQQGNFPILVVCYTNQALDQLLETVVEFKKAKQENQKYHHGGLKKDFSFNPHEIARLGSRGNDNAKDFSVHNLESIDWIIEPNGNKKKPKTIINDKQTKYLFTLKRKITNLNKKIKREMEFISDSMPSIQNLSKFIDPVHLNQLKSLYLCENQCLSAWLKCNQSSFGRKQQCFQRKKSSDIKCSTAKYSYSHDLKHCQVKPQDVYTEAEVKSITDITILTTRDKEKLYQYWMKLYHQNHYNEICSLIDDYNHIHADYVTASDRKTVELLQKTQIIFATTTGVAKNKHIINKVRIKIIIVEEAAEVLESHIISCLTAATQQLILIGDHKQLQPKPHEHILACKYRLNISLFQRLIEAGFPCATLQHQHRMRPEIADLVRPHVYRDLKDHDSVLGYENIRGIASNVYFFDHHYPEKLNRRSKSYFNEEEANLVAGLCDYLLKQGYEPCNITVLAAYTSQVNLLKKLIPTAVEELNDEPILADESDDAPEPEEISVSGKDDDIKNIIMVTTVDNFQGKENEIIILSLVRSNEVNAVGFLSKENRMCVALSRAKQGFYCFGNFHKLLFKVSPKTPSVLHREPSVWKQLSLHLTKKRQVGSELQLCCANHPESITTITKCTYFQKLPPDGGCWLRCNAKLSCGHKCTRNCHIKDQEHKMYQCKQSCLRKCLQCGSPCKQKCFMKCKRCDTLVNKKLPSCGHIQLVPCWMMPDEFKCQRKCNKTCTNGHPCLLKCSDECGDCIETSVEIRSCGHEVTLYCSENYAMSTTCSKPCEKKCTTNKNPHKCNKLCSEICGNCESLVKVTLPWCGHRQEVPCYMQHRLKHYANKIYCNADVTKVVPSCGHKVTIPCGKDAAAFNCRTLVSHKLPCGHSKGIECYRLRGISKQDKMWLLASEKCHVEIKKVFSICNHVVDLPCSDKDIKECPDPCDAVLLCGHRCCGNCHKCHQGRLHKPCMFHANKLLCDHQTTVSCGSSISQPYPKCSYRCKRYCPHTKCSHKCQDACKPCHKPCTWRCRHYKCTRKCFESCNRQRCYHPCPHVNKCGHQCIGVCGEPCPNVCNICDEEKFSQLYMSLNKFKTKYNTKYIQLDCGHLFKVTELDPWIDAHSKQFQLISCPKCDTIIHFYHRYGNAIRRVHENVDEICCEVNSKAGTVTFNKEKLHSLFDVVDKSLHIDEFDITSSSIKYIYRTLDSLQGLFECAKGNLFIESSLATVKQFLRVNIKSLSLQTIQDVTCEQRRLALWIMTYQLNSKTLDHADMSTIEQIESFITKLDYVHHNNRLFPQRAKILYTKLSNIAKKHKVELLDKDYILTPMLPVMYIGKWRQCCEGHFYCIPQPPPDIWCEFLTAQKCPICWEQYKDDGDSEDLMDTDGESN
ncbi:NFX1-type zinc finger-containing protein 1-like [Dysidea avara]|uniref:NFX1-type zinc finger-containing protein 1-like n=1 Tax=Dysidea avara TaxID=196820 RepID=UPI003333692A